MFSTPTSARCTKCGEVKHIAMNTMVPGMDSYIMLHESMSSHSSVCLPTPHQKRSEQISKLYEKLFSFSASPSSIPLITVNNNNASSYEEPAVNTGIIDQMCSACLEQLLEMANEEIEELQNEKILYSSRIEKRRSSSFNTTAVPSLLQNAQQNTENEEKEEEAEIEKLQKEELELRMKLVEHQMTLNSLQAKHKVQQAEMKQLNIAEEKYWLYFAKTTAANIAMRDNDDTLYNTFVRLSEENQKLTSALVNVEQAMFSIKEHPDKSVQINGFRLAKKKDIQWEEVNTALGLSMLLMIAIAKKRQFAFSTYALIPRGSTSLVQEMESGVNYELFHTGRRKNEGRFNSALKGFLCCLNELQQTVKKSPTMQANPFPIEGDSVIGGVSILYSPSDEETWSRAMRRVLINLMYLQKN